MRLKIQPLSGRSVGEQPMEMVERKGLGHPDTICDILAENLSKELCRFYQKHFGLVLHHNVDKGLLFGGRSRPAFGGGEILGADGGVPGRPGHHVSSRYERPC